MKSNKRPDTEFRRTCVDHLGILWTLEPSTRRPIPGCLDAAIPPSGEDLYGYRCKVSRVYHGYCYYCRSLDDPDARARLEGKQSSF